MKRQTKHSDRRSPVDDHLDNCIRTLPRSDFYLEMTRSLESVPDGNCIYLTSFQSSHPLDQRQSSEIKDYHSTLENALKSRHGQIEARRLVAFQRIQKLPWLDDLVSSLGQGDSNFTLCVYPARPEWETNDRLDPLPIQTQIIGKNVFFGAARTTDQETDEQMVGVHLPPSDEYATVRRYFQDHYSALWEYAASDRHSMLIRNGKANQELIDRYKWRVCASWLWHELRNVKNSELDLPRFKGKVLAELLPVENWYRHGIDSELIRDPYRRYPLLSSTRNQLFGGTTDQTQCEVMLARWNPGEECWPHDHGGASGVVFILQGEAIVNEYKYIGRELCYEPSVTERRFKAGEGNLVEKTTIHSMRSIGDKELVSLHVYLPEPEKIWIYDTKGKERLLIDRGGAFAPRDERAIRHREPIDFKDLASSSVGADEETRRKKGKSRKNMIPPTAEERIYDQWTFARQHGSTKEEFHRTSNLTMSLNELTLLLERVRKRRCKTPRNFD